MLPEIKNLTESNWRLHPDQTRLVLNQGLSALDLCKVSQVCKALMVFANESDRWKKLYTQDFDPSAHNLSNRECKRLYCQNIVDQTRGFNAEVRNALNLPCRDPTGLIREQLVKFPFTTEVCFSLSYHYILQWDTNKLDEDTMEEVAKNTRFLLSFRIQSEKFTSYRSIYIENILDLIVKHPEIEQLQFESCSFTSSANIIKILNMLPNLRSLHLKRSFHSKDCVSAIAKKIATMKLLRSLILEDGPKDESTPFGFSKMTKNDRLLIKLGCPRLTPTHCKIPIKGLLNKLTSIVS